MEAKKLEPNTLQIFTQPSRLAGALKAVREFTTNDTTRASLLNVCVERYAKGIRLTATDRHTLCSVELEAEVTHGVGPVRLSGEDVEVLIAQCKTVKDAGTATFNLVDAPGALPFPDYQQVIPAKDDGRGKRVHSFNPQYLARIATVQKALKLPKTLPGVRMQFGEDELSPLRVDVAGECGTAVIVIMPCRL